MFGRKNRYRMKLFFKLFLGVLFWGTYFLPIYAFEKTFRILGVDTNDFFGIYRDGILIFSTLSFVLTFLFLWLLPKLFRKYIYRIGIVIFYLIFYYFTCTSIAWDYRIVFGTTWQWSEIFPELVKPQWYFYVFGALGVFFNYQCMRLVQRKTIE